MNIFDITHLRVIKKYIIMYNVDKLYLYCSAYIPFGIEEFNNTHVVNLEFNENNDFLNIIKLIENKFKTHPVPSRYKYFISGLKKNNNNKIHLRCHIDLNLKLPINKNTSEPNIVIMLNNIWMYDDMFGLTWNITRI